MKNINRKGFTLIELLIVITIIGILAAALLPSVLGAPARARDAARKADLNNIIAALETYNSDNQNYPESATSGGDCVEDLGLDNYFQAANVPSDPQDEGLGTCTASYFYCELDGTPGSYLLATLVEIEGNANAMATDLDGLDCTGADDAPVLTVPDADGPWAYVIVK